jgi:hypothetical protein
VADNGRDHVQRIVAVNGSDPDSPGDRKQFLPDGLAEEVRRRLDDEHALAHGCKPKSLAGHRIGFAAPAWGRIDKEPHGSICNDGS